VRRIRPISHDDRLSVVDHLDELRSRLIVSALTFVAAWALTAWQNHLVLEIVNAPLPTDARGHQIQPITLGPAEAFYSTLTNAAYFALLIALPVILYQLYAFVLPAFSPTERRVATPLILMVPVLFILGVVFCYFVVLTPALKFLLNFNADEFNTQVRARDYYSFVTLLMLAMGIGFQIPVGVLAACKLGLTSADKLRRSRRYAVVAIVILASLLPTLDPLTLILESIPLYALYEFSIVLAARFGKATDEVEEEPAVEEERPVEDPPVEGL
jgi:sec-independent protein translocase protein TatC